MDAESSFQVETGFLVEELESKRWLKPQVAELESKRILKQAVTPTGKLCMQHASETGREAGIVRRFLADWSQKTMQIKLKK